VVLHVGLKDQSVTSSSDCYRSSDVPTANQSGGTIWHFRFPFRLTAIQSGTLVRIGGLKGP
jgi:hypothetical protein